LTKDTIIISNLQLLPKLVFSLLHDKKENTVYAATIEYLHDEPTSNAILKEEIIVQAFKDDNGNVEE
jgi:hypothetical protein